MVIQKISVSKILSTEKGRVFALELKFPAVGDVIPNAFQSDIVVEGGSLVFNGFDRTS